MPTYEYKCRDCGHTFEKLMTMHEHEQAKKPQCPKCRSNKVEQLPAGFRAVTSDKA